jgi:hypothetical protein
MLTNSPIGQNTKSDHNHFINENIMLGTNIFSAPIIESDKLQTTQHDNAIGGNVTIVYFGFQPPPPFAITSSQILQESGVPNTSKDQSHTEHEILLFRV